MKKFKQLAVCLWAIISVLAGLLVWKSSESHRLQETVRQQQAIIEKHGQQQAIIEKQGRELQAYHKSFEDMFSEYDLLLQKYLWLESKTKKAGL